MALKRRHKYALHALLPILTGLDEAITEVYDAGTQMQQAHLDNAIEALITAKTVIENLVSDADEPKHRKKGKASDE